jgi:hypothetical protein
VGFQDAGGNRGSYGRKTYPSASAGIYEVIVLLCRQE